MTIITWLVIGAIGGYAANFLLGQRSGLISTVVFGILGAIVGGGIGSFITGGGFDFNALLTGFNVESIVVAILGSLGLGAVGAWWQKRGAT